MSLPSLLKSEGLVLIDGEGTEPAYMMVRDHLKVISRSLSKPRTKQDNDCPLGLTPQGRTWLGPGQTMQQVMSTHLQAFQSVKEERKTGASGFMQRHKCEAPRRSQSLHAQSRVMSEKCRRDSHVVCNQAQACCSNSCLGLLHPLCSIVTTSAHEHGGRSAPSSPCHPPWLLTAGCAMQIGVCRLPGRPG